MLLPSCYGASDNHPYTATRNADGSLIVVQEVNPCFTITAKEVGMTTLINHPPILNAFMASLATAGYTAEQQENAIAFIRSLEKAAKSSSAQAAASTASYSSASSAAAAACTSSSTVTTAAPTTSKTNN